MKLEDAVRDIDQLPRKAVIHVPRDEPDVSPSTSVVLVSDTEPSPPGWRYFLELLTVREVIEVWISWHNGLTPSLEQACGAVIYYGNNDAYLIDDVEY